MNTRGALPSTGRDPGRKDTSVPSETVAKVFHGTAIAVISRRPAALAEIWI